MDIQRIRISRSRVSRVCGRRDGRGAGEYGPCREYHTRFNAACSEHMRNRLPPILPCIVLSLALVSCAPARQSVPVFATRSQSAAQSTSTPAPPQLLVLVETAYRWIPPGIPYPGNSSVDFAYVLKNPNQDFGATAATLRVTMRNSAGKVLFTYDDPVWPIRPGETIVGEDEEYADHRPASVQFQLLTPASSWVPTDRWVPSGFKPLQVVDLKLHRSKGKFAGLVGFPSGYSYFTCVVENPNAVGFKDFIIDVLHRDAKGTIVAAYQDLGDKVSADGRVAFRLDTPDKLPPGDTYEAFARPWYDTKDELPIRTGKSP